MNGLEICFKYRAFSAGTCLMADAYNIYMTKIEFTARETTGGKEFICARCSGQVFKLAERQYARQRPYVMECKKCGLVSGSWETDDERDQFLREMPALN
jgi:hypothetical protein